MQGNLLEAAGAEGSTWFSYNAFNQQTEVLTADGERLENQYDAEYLRAGTIENGEKRTFLYYNGELTTNYVGTKVLKLGTTQKSTSTTSTSAVTSNASLTKTSSVVTSDVSSVVENVMPSIVSITNMSVQEVQNYFGGTSKQESESAGTGIIISQNDSELLVVTNNHVVAGSDTLTVTFADGNSVEANIKGTDC